MAAAQSVQVSATREPGSAQKSVLPRLFNFTVILFKSATDSACRRGRLLMCELAFVPATARAEAAMTKNWIRPVLRAGVVAGAVLALGGCAYGYGGYGYGPGWGYGGPVYGGGGLLFGDGWGWGGWERGWAGRRFAGEEIRERGRAFDRGRIGDFGRFAGGHAGAFRMAGGHFGGHFGGGHFGGGRR
jgi:hypothetical protein